jgi:hypothetical protein
VALDAASVGQRARTCDGAHGDEFAYACGDTLGDARGDDLRPRPLRR